MGTTDDVREKAQALLAARLNVVDALKSADDEEETAREALRAAERTKARAWQEAIGTGWTARELKSMGFKEPGIKAPGRPRRERQDSTPAEVAGTAPVVPPRAPAAPQAESSVTSA